MAEKTDEYCVVITTCRNQAEAEELANLIMEMRLAACIQLSNIVSIYRWDGQVCHDDEIRLMIKTTAACYDALEHCIIDNHPAYDTPEIIMLPIQNGSNSYLNWLRENCDC